MAKDMPKVAPAVPEGYKGPTAEYLTTYEGPSLRKVRSGGKGEEGGRESTWVGGLEGRKRVYVGSLRLYKLSIKIDRERL